MNGQSCPSCGATNPFGELLCQSCGQSLPRPSAAAVRELRAGQARDEALKRRRDLAVAAAIAVVTGLGFRLLSESMPPETVGGVAGRQLWWLLGLFWGGVAWVVRRFTFY